MIHCAVNHYAIFKNVGITPVNYPYYDPRTLGVDFEGLKSTFENAPPGSVILLHSCAHNPTGIDPTREQWKIIAEIMLSKRHYAFFDSAYQGFASGDLDNDGWAVRYFSEKGVPMLICQVSGCVEVFLGGQVLTNRANRASQRTLGCTASEWGHSI